MMKQIHFSRRVLAVVLTVSLLLSSMVVGIALPASAAVSAFANGDFESGQVTPWVVGDGCTATVSNSAARSGSYGLELKSSSENWAGITQPFAAEGGESYTVTFYAKSIISKVGTNFCWFIKNATDSENLYAGWDNDTVTGAVDWVKLSKTVTIPSGDSSARITIVPNGSDVYIDDITIEKVVPEDKSVLANGDFEQGNKVWTLDKGSIVAEAAKDGKYGLKMGGSNWNIAATNYLKVKKNTYYAVDMDCNCEKGTDIAVFLKKCDSTGGGTLSDIDGLYFKTAAGKWEHQSKVFYSGDAEYVLVEFNQGDNSDTKYVDNVRILELRLGDSIVANGDFESGKTGWNGNASVEDGIGNPGKAAKLSGSSWGVNVYTNDFTVEPGATYILSYDYKATATGAVYLKGTNLEFWPDSTNGEWKTYTHSCPIPADTKAVHFELNICGTTSDKYVDNVKLCKLIYPSDGVLANGDFENGKTDWVIGTGTIGAEAAKDGAAGLKMTGGNWSVAAHTKALAVEKDAMYKVSFDAKWENANQDIAIFVKSCNAFGDAIADVGDGKYFKAEAGKWVHNSLVFNAGSAEYIYFEFNQGENSGTKFVDNVTIEKIVPTGDNLVANGDFEQGETGWTFGGSASVVNAGGNPGKAAKISGSAWGANIYTADFAVEAGEPYCLSYDLKSTDGAAVYLKGSNLEFWPGSTNGEWQTVTQYFTMPAGVSKIHFEMNIGGNSADKYVDNVSLRKLAPEKKMLVNGDFEKGETDWKVGTGSICAEAAYKSNLGLKMTGSNWSVAASTYFPVKQNTCYLIKLDANCKNGTDIACYVKSCDDKGGNVGGVLSEDAYLKTSPDTWEEKEFRFYTGKADYVFLEFNQGENSDTKYVDNVTIQEIATGKNLVVNGDFENGTTGWNGANLAAVTGGNPGNTLKITGGEWASVWTDAMTVEAGETYVLSYDRKSTNGMAIYINNGAGNNLKDFWPGSTDGAWKTENIFYTIPAGTTSLKIEFNISGNTDVKYIDNVSLRKLDLGETKEPSYDGFVYNGDFETGKLAPWTNECNAAISKEAHEGTYAMLLKGNQWASIYQDFEVTPGKYYHISFYAKRVAGTGLHHVWVKGDNGTLTDIADLRFDLAGQNDWTKLEMTVGADTYSKMSLRFGIEDAASQFLIDDLVVEEITASTIMNADFETGKLYPWTANCATATVTADEHHSGTYALKIGSASEDWTGVSQKFPIEGGATYKISFYAKKEATKATTNFCWYVKSGDDKDELYAGFDNDKVTGSEWVLLSKEVEIPKKETDIRITIDPNGGTYYIDDVTVTKISVTDTDIIKGGDFECDNPLQYWVPGSEMTKEVIAAAAKDGSYGLHLSSKKDSWQSFLQKFNAIGGGTYKISFDVKLIGSSAGNFVWYIKNKADNKEIFPGWDSSKLKKNEWVTLTTTFEVPTTDDQAIFTICPEGADVYVDNIVATLLAAPDSDGYISNGKFESGMLNGWTADNSSEVVTTPVHGGKYALMLAGEAWAPFSQSFNVEPGAKYELTMYIRADAGNTAGAKPGIFLKDKDNTKELKTEPDVSTSEWTEVKIPFEGDANGVMNLYLYTQNGDQIFYIDDIGVVRTGDPGSSSQFDDEPAVVDPEKNILKNGGFENGETGWEISKNEPYNILYEISSKAKDTGDYGFILHGADAGSYKWGHLQQTFKTTPHMVYRLVYRWKDMSHTDYISVTVRDAAANGERVYLEVPKSANEGWHTVDTTFRSGDFTEMRVLFCPESCKGDFYIDNVHIECLGQDTALDTVSTFHPKTLVAKDEASNLIKDASFEKFFQKAAGVAQWNTPTLLDNAYVTVVNDAANAADGNNYLKIDSNGAGKGFKVYFTVDVEPETDYIFSAWVKGAYLSEKNAANLTFGIMDSATGTFLLGPPCDDGDDNTGKYKDFTATRQLVPTAYDNHWHLRGLEFNSAGRTQVQIAIMGDDTQAFLDGLTLCKTTNAVKPANPKVTSVIGAMPHEGEEGCAPEDNLVEDFNFESKDHSFWTEVPGYGNFVNVKYAGKGYGTSMLYKESDNPNGRYYIRWIEVKPNTDYTLTFDVLVNKTGEGYVGLVDGNEYVPQDAFVYTFEDGTDGEWQKLSIDFNSTAYSRVGFFVCDKGGEALLDNIRLFETSKATAIKDNDGFDPDEKPLPDDPDNPEDPDNPDGPKTGDSLVIVFASLLVAIFCAAVAFFARKKTLCK